MTRRQQRRIRARPWARVGARGPGAAVVATVLAAAVLAVSVLASTASPAGAQDPATTTTTTTAAVTTTAPPVPETSTTSPPDETSTTVAGDPNVTSTTTTTTVAPPVTDLFGATGEGAGDDGSGDPAAAYSRQGAFDPASKAVLAEQLAEARATLRDVERQRDAAAVALTALRTRRVEVQARIELTGEGSRRAIDDVVEARDLLRRRAIAAFVGSAPDDTSLFGVLDRPAEYSIAHEYMQRIADTQRAAVHTLDEARAQLGDQDRALAEESASLDGQITAAQALLDQITAVADAQQLVVDAFAAGSHVGVAGFVFPVVGTVSFSDSWGAPRLAGTSQAHWHEGCDIMAPLGREMVAVETGVVTRAGVNGLGGNSLSITGLSGTRYYYAHLSAMAPGMVVGTPVTIGQIVGYVGNTGDAAGGPTHLHFEIHPGGGAAVDPYPLLRAAYDARRRAELAAGLSLGPRRV